MADGPKVRRLAQPMGDAGIAHSLDQVALKAIEGGKDEVVRAWDTHVLKACGFPKGARARAECFLADTRLYPWIPDPTDVEFIPAARLMMPNVLTGEGPVYLADDCDGLTVRWIAMCLAAGIRCQIVGYSFDHDAEKQISHVLGSIWDDVAEEWVDGDPSFQDMPLGQTQAHTREQRRDLPSMSITCDDVACDIHQKPGNEGAVDFLSVGSPNPAAPRPASTVGMPSLEDVGLDFLSQADDIEAHWNELRTVYDAMRETFAADGFTTPEQLAPYGWSAEDQQRAINIGVMATITQRYLREAASGARSIWPVLSSPTAPNAGISDEIEKRCVSTGGKWDKATFDANSGGSSGCACPAGFAFDFLSGGCVDPKGIPHEATWAIERRPEDVFAVELDAAGDPVLVNAQGQAINAPPSNTIGANPLLVVGAAAVMYAIIAYAVTRVLATLRDIARDAEEAYLEAKTMECYQPNSGVSQADCDKRVADRRAFKLKLAEAEAKLHQTEGDADPLTKLSKILNTAVYAGGAVLTIYGVAKLFGFLSEKRAAKA